MFRYTVFSLIIESEIELPELSPGLGKPDVIIRTGKVSPDGQVHATIGNEFVCPALLGRFQITGGSEIVVDALPDADPGVIRILLQGRLMACLLRQRDCVPLHASAVAIRGKAVLFAGESGAGKSTTASAFHVSGYSVLTDDVAAIRIKDGTALMLTGWSGLRLLPEAGGMLRRQVEPSAFLDDKHVFTLERPEFGKTVPVERIYFLEFAEIGTASPRSEVVSEAVAAAWLNANSFLRTWRASSDLLEANLRRSAQVAATVPVYRLIRPRALGSLPGLVDYVERDFAADE